MLKQYEMTGYRAALYPMCTEPIRWQSFRAIGRGNSENAWRKIYIWAHLPNIAYVPVMAYGRNRLTVTETHPNPDPRPKTTD